MAKKKSGGTTTGTSAGVTICLGNYQTARFDCWLTLPSGPASASRLFHKCEDFINEKIAVEVGKIQGENQQIKGQLKQDADP